jgi:hypothetical protein
LALAAPATAAPTLALPGSENGDIAVDARGAAHVILEVTPADGSTAEDIQYCRIPPGGARCEKLALLPRFPLGRSAPQILIDQENGRLVVVDQRCCGNADDMNGVWVTTSSDGGDAWSPPLRIGPSGHGAIRQAVLTSDGTVLLLNGLYDVYNPNVENSFSADRLDGSSAGVVFLDRNAPTDERSSYQTVAIGILADGRLWALGTGPTQGSAAATAIRTLRGDDANQLASWTPWSPVRQIVPAIFLGASGPKGGFLMYKAGRPYGRLGFQADRWEVAPVTPTGRLGPPELLTGLFKPGGGADNGDLAADPAGGLHAVWQASNGEGCPNALVTCLIYRYRPPGRAFGPKSIAYDTGGHVRDIANPEVAANAAGTAWALWNDNYHAFRVGQMHVSSEAQVGTTRLLLNGPRACVKRSAGLKVSVTARGPGRIAGVVFRFREYLAPPRPPAVVPDTHLPFEARFPLGRHTPKAMRGLRSRMLTATVTVRAGGPPRRAVLSQPIDLCSELTAAADYSKGPFDNADTPGHAR